MVVRLPRVPGDNGCTALLGDAHNRGAHAGVYEARIRIPAGIVQLWLGLGFARCWGSCITIGVASLSETLFVPDATPRFTKRDVSMKRRALASSKPSLTPGTQRSLVGSWNAERKCCSGIVVMAREPIMFKTDYSGLLLQQMLLGQKGFRVTPNGVRHGTTSLRSTDRTAPLRCIPSHSQRLHLARHGCMITVPAACTRENHQRLLGQAWAPPAAVHVYRCGPCAF